MTEPKQPTRPRRNYPAVYEKLIPIALGGIVVATLAALLFALAVALRLLPGVTP
jgi:hypothetical protein